MKKNYAKTKLVIIAVFVIIGLCLTVLSFDIPGTADKFLGFIGAMDKSTELGDQYKVVFTVDTSNGTENSEINKSIEIMHDIFLNYIPGYGDIKITRGRTAADEQIIAYVPQKSLNSNFFTVFGKKMKIVGKTANGSTVITNDNIEVAQYSQYNGHYGVYLKLDNAGTKALIQYDDALTFTIDDDSATGTNVNSLLFVYTDSISASASAASNATISLMAGKLPVDISVETTTITAQSGETTKTALIVATICIAVFYAIYMIIAHKLLGLVSLLIGAIYVILYTFVLQSTAISSMDLASYFAMIVAFILFALANDYQLDKMSKAYTKGVGVRDIEISVEHGYKQSLYPLMDIHLVTVIFALSVLIIGGRTFGSISFNIIIGSIISALLTMFINKFIIGLLAKAYSENNKVFNFKREA